MTKDQFTEQINRLIDTYGARAYPKERIKGIWAAFKHFHIDDFRSGITVIINENYYPPMLAKMREQIRYTPRGIDSGVDCDHCDRVGLLLCYKEGCDQALPAGTFRCHCENGNLYTAFLPFERGRGYIPINEYYKVKDHELFGNRSREERWAYLNERVREYCKAMGDAHVSNSVQS
jgi:hypothetical protein